MKTYVTFSRSYISSLITPVGSSSISPASTPLRAESIGSDDWFKARGLHPVKIEKESLYTHHIAPSPELPELDLAED